MEPGCQFLRVERFDETGVNSRIQPADALLDVIDVGQKKDRNVLDLGFPIMKRLEPLRLGVREVQNDGVEARSVEAFPILGRNGGDLRVEARPA
jgi:hypothetical protein